jgi:hypothetical protein
MRRTAAFALLLMLLAPTCSLALPLLFADQSSDLPACCRRDGKHHCAMMDMANSNAAGATNGSPAFGAAQLRCPFRPTRFGVMGQSSVLYAVRPATFLAVNSLLATVQRENELKLLGIGHPSNQKRGPPSLL